VAAALLVVVWPVMNCMKMHGPANVKYCVLFVFFVCGSLLMCYLTDNPEDVKAVSKHAWRVRCVMAHYGHH
jgi:hypothetical protein